MDPNINSNGIYSFLKRPKLLQHREIRLFYIEFLNVVNPHFPDATPIYTNINNEKKREAIDRLEKRQFE